MFYRIRLRQLVLSLLLAFAATGCENTVPEVSPKLEEEPVTVYNIKAGTHFSENNPFRILTSNHIRFEATFDKTAIYTTSDSKNQADINKLFGISDCGTDHHTNSARFGWRWYQGRLEIHAYTYHNKKVSIAYIGSVVVGKPAVYELLIGNQDYTFRVNDQQVVVPRHCTGAAGGYQLYPYFGGDETAPHDITIRIREL